MDDFRKRLTERAMAN